MGRGLRGMRRGVGHVGRGSVPTGTHGFGSGYCLRTRGGGGCLGPWPAPAPADPPTHPPTQIRKMFLRKKMKLIKGAGNLRPILGTQTFLASGPLLPGKRGGGFSFSNRLVWGFQEEIVHSARPKSRGTSTVGT